LKSLNYEVIPIELFVDMKTFQKFVEVGYKTMLNILVPLSVYLVINLKDESFEYIDFHDPHFWSIQKLILIDSMGVQCFFPLPKS
jgi:hypothetical protein